MTTINSTQNIPIATLPNRDAIAHSFSPDGTEKSRATLLNDENSDAIAVTACPSSTSVTLTNTAVSSNTSSLGKCDTYRVLQASSTLEALADSNEIGDSAKPLRRVKRALEEPKQLINESWSHWQARHFKWRTGRDVPLGSPLIPEDEGKLPKPPVWQQILEGVGGLILGGPLPKWPGGIGRIPLPVRLRPSVPIESRPLIPVKQVAPVSVEPIPAPVRPPVLYGEGVAIQPGEESASGINLDIGEPAPTTTGNSVPGRQTTPRPEILTQSEWDGSPKDGLDSDLVNRINDAYEDGQDVRIYKSENGDTTYLIYDDEDGVFISIANNKTWSPPEYNYRTLGTWQTGRPNQQYAPVGDFVSNRPNLEEDRAASVIDGIVNGRRIDPVKVTRNQHGQYEIVNGHHRYRAAQQLGLNTMPFEIAV